MQAVQVEPSPEEVFKTFHGDMLREHPQTHLTMIEVFFTLASANADKYQLRSIKWLKDTDNVNAYIAGVAGRFPNIPEEFITRAVHSLRAVLRAMEEWKPNEQALGVIDMLLDQLSKKERHGDIRGAILQTLYVITQKTKCMTVWDLNSIKKLCETIVPFVQDQHPMVVRVYTYGIYANLLSVEHAPSIIASLGITSVPEDILTYAGMKMDEGLKEVLKRLQNQEEESKKEEGKAEKPNNENFPASEQLSVPVTESGLIVNPFGPAFSSVGREAAPCAKAHCGGPDSNPDPIPGCFPSADPHLSPRVPCLYQQSLSRKRKGKRKNKKAKVKPIEDEWKPNSKRWRDQLTKLQSADESEVTRIGNMIYIKKAEFCIPKGSNGTEVYLGLRDDGTELAIKVAPKSNSRVLNEKGILRLPGLKRARIVRYIDYKEDEQFSYLALELCEYTLEEYIKINNGDRRKLVFQILEGLKALHSQNPPIVYGNLNSQNILIDVNGEALLADFGGSRRLPTGETEFSMDIDMAGELIHYIYAYNRDVPRDDVQKGTYNLDHVKDVLANDLIIKMKTDAKPQNSVEECLNHPLFWSTERRVNYLKEVGNRKEVKSCGNAGAELISSMDDVGGGSYRQWKEKFPSELVEKLEKRGKRGRLYPDNMLGLLRFTRNVYQHHPKYAAKVHLLSKFPHLFEHGYMFAENQEWNSEPLLKQLLMIRDDSPAKTVTNYDEPVPDSSVQETQPSPRVFAE